MHGFSFNLISNKNDAHECSVHIIQDPKGEEITWIGLLGVVVRGTRYKTQTNLCFHPSGKKIYIQDKVTSLTQKVEHLTFSTGKLSIAVCLKT